MARVLVVPDAPDAIGGPVELLCDDETGSWDGVCSCGWRVVFESQRFLAMGDAAQIAEQHVESCAS